MMESVMRYFEGYFDDFNRNYGNTNGQSVHSSKQIAKNINENNKQIVMCS